MSLRRNKVYMYCSYESHLVNLFECIMFAEEVVQGLGDDLLELIDYCWRNVSSLFAQGDKLNEITEDISLADEAEPNGPKRFWFQANTLHTTNAMSCVSLLWYIVDRLKVLPFP